MMAMMMRPPTQIQGRMPSVAGGTSAGGAPAGLGLGTVTVSAADGAAAGDVAAVPASAAAGGGPATLVAKLAKNSSAIFRAAPSISRAPIWASLPPIAALTVY